MDGLAKNLRNLGEGKVFVFATAQQTLTEDNKTAALNSTELFKLKDRFPMAVTLESSDIEEICYKRLLKKSADGEEKLKNLFAANGQKLVAKTKLANCSAIESKPLTERTYIEFYPFLPSHFKILLSLLSELSRSTGGVGLRSAIKVVQDILIDGENNLVSAPAGRLVTAEDFFEQLQKDIQRAQQSLHASALSTIAAYRNDPDDLFVKVAKALVITDIIKDFEASPKNIAALLQDGIRQNITPDSVARVLRAMATTDDKTVHIKEDSKGTFHYLTERQRTLEDERQRYVPYQPDRRNLMDGIYGEIFRPARKIDNGFGFSCPVGFTEFSQDKISQAPSLPVRIVLCLYGSGERESVISQALAQSLQKKGDLYVITQSPDSIDMAVDDILRYRHMEKLYGQDADPETKDWAADQSAKAAREEQMLTAQLREKLKKGTFIKRGEERAPDTVGKDPFIESLKGQLVELVDLVYYKNDQAPGTVPQETASRLLALRSNQPSDHKDDPKGVLLFDAGELKLNDQHPALLSLCEELGRQDFMCGSDLFDHFAGVPYGWTQEMVLYLVAALFWAGKVELNISGQRYQTQERAVADAFKKPKTFKPVRVMLRKAAASTDDCMELASFLNEFGIAYLGMTEGAIAQSKKDFIKRFQEMTDELIKEVDELRTSGGDQLKGVDRTLEKIDFGSVTDFAQTIRGETGIAFKESLQWMLELKKADSNGLFSVLREVRLVQNELECLPHEMPAHSELAKQSAEINKALQQTSFLQKLTDFRAFVGQFKAAKEKAVQLRYQQLQEAVSKADRVEQNLVRDKALSEEERQQLLRKVPTIDTNSSNSDLGTLSTLLLSAKDRPTRLRAIVNDLVQRRQSIELAKTARLLELPRRIVSVEELRCVIDSLEKLQAEMSGISEITIDLKD